MPRNYKFQDKIDVGHRGQFLIDCIREAGVTPVEGWEYPTNDKEFFRFCNWVRRVLEECNWWELNGGSETKNINVHIQYRLLSNYRDIVDEDLLPPEYMGRLRLPSNEGVQPAQASYHDWYLKRGREARLWYEHWCTHIGGIKGAGFGNQANRRLMRFRNMFQLFNRSKSLKT